MRRALRVFPSSDCDALFPTLDGDASISELFADDPFVQTMAGVK
ncbi:MAG: hypothetical protein QOD94_66 [Alphaproteobacteria bacterium]|nr:hypothetical protein [Alphaproteobacteria bacterium]